MSNNFAENYQAEDCPEEISGILWLMDLVASKYFQSQIIVEPLKFCYLMVIVLIIFPKFGPSDLTNVKISILLQLHLQLQLQP